MCWQLAAAAALSAAGSMVQSRAQAAALDRQMKLAMQQKQLQDAYGNQATAAAMQEVEKYRPESREQQQQQVEESLAAKLTAPYTTGEYAGPQAPRYAGLQTESHVKDTALATERVLSQAFDRAKLQAKLLAPQYLRMGEGFRLADTSGNIGMLERFSRGSAAAAEPGIKAAGVPSGGAMALGAGLQGLGSGMALQGIYGGTGAGTGAFAGYTPSPQLGGAAATLQYPAAGAYNPLSSYFNYVPLR